MIDPKQLIEECKRHLRDNTTHKQQYQTDIRKLITALKQALSLGVVMQWVAVEDDKPKDCESLIGIEMPYEARYACHREDNMYVSDETGESVIITHWMYAPKPPCA